MRAALNLAIYAAASWWWLGPASGALLAGAGLAAAWSAWLAGGLAVLGIAGTALESRAKSAAKARSDEFKVLLNDCLQPLARSLLVLALKTTDKRRSEQLPNVLWPVLTAALSLTDVARSRASFFMRVHDDGTDWFVPHPTLSIGRGDAPTSRFRRGVGEGKEVWRAAEAGEPSYYPDLDGAAPPGMDAARPRSYRTFIITMTSQGVV